MPELSGPIQHVVLVQWLWLIPALPFVGSLINAFYSSGLLGKAWDGLRIALADEDKPKPKPAPRKKAGEAFVSNVAIGAMVCAFGIVVWHFAMLLMHPGSERFLMTHGWRMVRFGQLDINFDLAMDPLSGLMCLIITGIGSLIHVYASSYMEGDPDYWRFFAWLNLFVFSMLLLVLGDNFFVMFFGWEGVGLCSYGLIGFWWRDYKKATAGMKAFVTNRVGDFGFVMGAALLFWGLGGQWSPEGDYSSDLNPRFEAVSVKAEAGEHGEEAAEGAKGHEAKGEAKAEAEAKAGARHEAKEKAEAEEHEHGRPGPGADKNKPTVKATSGKGYLTLTALPGAIVYMDDSRNPLLNADGTPLRSPFVRHELQGGVHTFRIAPDDDFHITAEKAVIVEQGVQDNSIVSHVAIGDDKEIALTLMGPTVTFRSLRDQFVTADGKGEHPVLDALMAKKAWGRMGVIFLSCVLLFVGACGKSAQVPLYVWLPDAMAGPTPVSALIHAATMVTAGVYMIARLNFLFSLSPTACGIIAFTGAFTALFAATMGLFQYDIKKVLAYSTVSQLGFMFIGVGVGAYWAGVFHLMTHAFFKACLFLGAGSVIHGMHAVEHDEVLSQDMRNMGGLKKQMPKTALTYFVACLAITAAPIPFFAGFWSKDEILFRAFTSENIGFMPPVLIYAIGLVAAACTSFYMWRSYYLTFEGKPRRNDLHKVHESPVRVTFVLQVLAVLSTIGGVLFGLSSHLIGGSGSPLLEEWLEPVTEHARVAFREPGLGLEYGLMALSVGLAIASWAYAKSRYGDKRDPAWDTAEQKVPGFDLLYNKYYVDELYRATIIAFVLRLRLVLAQMDRYVVDGIVNGVSVIVRAVAWINGTIDAKIVDGAVNFVAEGTLSAGNKLRGLQTGRVQTYIYGALGGVAFFALVQYFFSFGK